MEQKADFNYRPYVAMGVILVMGILALRMPVESTENAFNHLVGAAFKVTPSNIVLTHTSISLAALHWKRSSIRFHLESS